MDRNTPKQRDGSCLDTVRKIKFPSDTITLQHFNTVKEKLLNINSWYELCENQHSRFVLYDQAGLIKNGLPAKGDFIRINVKGLENDSGEGDDWVCIENIIDEDDRCSFRVRPCSAPLNSSNDVAHFFDERSTNTFEVRHYGNEVSVEIHGRNEHINTDTEHILTAIRNTAMAVGGFLFGSKSQWEKLAEGLISEKIIV